MQVRKPKIEKTPLGWQVKIWYRPRAFNLFGVEAEKERQSIYDDSYRIVLFKTWRRAVFAVVSGELSEHGPRR